MNTNSSIGQPIAKSIKNILAVLIIAFLIWFLSKHWHDLRGLLKLGAVELVVIYSITFIGALNASFTVQYLLKKALNVKTVLIDMVLLQNASYLLSYVPMKFSTVFRANYLKSHYGLSYARFGMFFIYLTLLLMVAATGAALMALLIFFGLASYEKKILAVAFLIVLFGSFLVAFVPLPVPAGTNKFSAFVRNILDSRHQLAQSKLSLLVCTNLLVLNFLLASLRLGIIYHAMGQNLHPAGFLILGAMGYFTMFINITPGALGIRELVLGSAATLIGIPLEIGMLAAMIDRAIALSYSFVIGGIAA
ncbi:MAG: lysylphosphatidylglycerol synthase domain-containing protein [Planctomycetota bacterium]|jgi:uncharacterized membrane protein YbhN (UPF0104 family)